MRYPWRSPAHGAGSGKGCLEGDGVTLVGSPCSKAEGNNGASRLWTLRRVPRSQVAANAAGSSELQR